jgi:outer membrane protein TolC
MRLKTSAGLLLLASVLAVAARGAKPTYDIDQAVAMAQAQNSEIIIARKQVEAARGDLLSARSGYLPSVVSTGLLDKREHQQPTNLREEDYNASVRLLQNVYTGGAVASQLAIARLNVEKQEYELEEVANRVTMEVRIAFNELLLNRAKVRVHEDSVRVLQEELKSQEERLSAGIVGTLNVQRAEVALANERPEFYNAQTQLKNSYLRLGELCGISFEPAAEEAPFEVAGELQVQSPHPDLVECLARADANRGVIKERENDIKIQDRQYTLDQSELRPQVQFFSGYEAYSERDPAVGPEFNHGYLVGVTANWHVFDGFATKGKLQATRARRDAATQGLEAARRSVAAEVRSAFFDFDQAARVLETETKNGQTADESLKIAKSNFAAGLGTQLDILQAATDVTRTRTTRLSAIYLHNVALARLTRACGGSLEALAFDPPAKNEPKKEQRVSDIPQLTKKRTNR